MLLTKISKYLNLQLSQHVKKKVKKKKKQSNHVSSHSGRRAFLPAQSVRLQREARVQKHKTTQTQPNATLIPLKEI